MAGNSFILKCRICGDKALHQKAEKVGGFIIWQAVCRKHREET